MPASDDKHDAPDHGMMVIDASMLAGRIWAVTQDLALAFSQGISMPQTWVARAQEILAELEDEDAEEVVAASMVAGPRAQHGPGVAVIPLQGVITPKPSLLAMLFGGGGGLQSFNRQLAAAVASPDVSHIMLNIDSPGGSVDLVPETAAAIRKAGSVKPIVAQVNPMAASAAYWLASQAHEIAITPSGQAGSVGVYKLHQDLSGAHEQRGVVPTLISAGNHKVDGNPFEPLAGEAKARVQQDVNDYYGMFVDDVARGRGVESPGIEGDAFGGGNTDIGKRAVRNGLADKVATFDETLKRLTSGRARVSNAPAAEDFDEADEDDLLDDEDDGDDDGTDAASPRRLSQEDKTAVADLLFGGFGSINERQEVANA
jgi:capsid assembly protease